MRSTLLLPLGALGISLYAVFFPGLLAQLGGAIVPLLGLVMLGMGLTLRLEHFLEVLRRPRLILLGVGLQYLLMPLIAWAVSRALGLPAALALYLSIAGLSFFYFSNTHPSSNSISIAINIASVAS